MKKLVRYQDYIYLSLLVFLSSFHFLFALRTNLFFKVDDFFVLSYFKNHNMIEMISSFFLQGDLFGFRKILGYVNLRILFDIFRTNPIPYIINNHLIHVLNLILLYLIAKKITKKSFIAFFVAVIFNKYYLFYFSNIHEYLVTLFSLSSIYLYLKFPKKIYSLIFFVLALLTKEVAFTVPFLLLALSINKHAKKANLKPFFIVLSVYVFYQCLFFLKGNPLPIGNESYILTFNIREIILNFFFFVSPLLITSLLLGALIAKKPKLLFLLLVALITLLPSLLLKNRHEAYYIYLPVTYILIYLTTLLPSLSINTFLIYVAVLYIFGGRSIFPLIARQNYPNWDKIAIENVVEKVKSSTNNNSDTQEIDIKDINLTRDAKIMLQTNTLDLFFPEQLANSYNFSFIEAKSLIIVKKK